MSNDHVNPILRQALVAIESAASPSVRAVMQADRQLVDALQERIRFLEAHIEELQDQVQAQPNIPEVNEILSRSYWKIDAVMHCMIGEGYAELQNARQSIRDALTLLGIKQP